MKQTLIEDMLSALDVPYTRGYIKKMFTGIHIDIHYMGYAQCYCNME